ncbi:hypothetical protein [Micromonospora sp. KC213]|uniref:hypothetical protein n=1 Tax=Micromonospora sp. KC213 TaxID=2530378 RepID=UPI00104B5517|nr:hypothetical protein [Micromonospora sp. KC213]TDC35721.1 hypothetical protein E1166_23275 [Micromonospora sp. KC213]
MTTKDDLGDALTKSLRAIRRLGDDRGDRERRTRLYREAAGLILDLREHFRANEKGDPDWAGRTPAYRAFIRERYSEAGYRREEAKPIQTAIGYHVSVLMRERLTPEEIEDLGLRTEDVTARVRDRRKVQSAMLATLDTTEGTPDAVRSLAGALAVLRRIAPDDLAALDGAAVAQARAVLTRLTDRVAELSRLAAAASDAGVTK